MPAHNCASYLLPPPLFSGRENSNLSKELRESGFVNRSEVGKGKINDVSGRAGEGEEAARDCVSFLLSLHRLFLARSAAAEAKC